MQETKTIEIPLNTGTGLRVSLLHVKNFKRIEELTIESGQKSLIILRGQNESGKTSVLDAIAAACGGKKAAPEEPIRNGTDTAFVEMVLCDAMAERYRIVRAFKGDDSYLHVYEKTARGEAKVASPQKFLDSIVGSLAFRPLDFSEAMDSKQQVKLLLKALGKENEYTAAQARRKAIYDRRAETNKELATQEASLNDNPDPSPGKKLELKTADDLQKQLNEIHAHNQQQIELKNAAATARRDAEESVKDYKKLQADIAEAENNLARMKEMLSQKEAIAQSKSRESTAADLRVSSFQPKDNKGIANEIATIAEHNGKVTQQERRTKLLAKIDELRAKTQAESDQIKGIDDELESIVSASDIGKRVPGIAVTDGVVTHNGVPFSQASGMRRLEISCLIGMSANPGLHCMCIDEADGLDDAAIQRLLEIATEKDYAFWMTAVRVDSQDGNAHVVQMKDGKTTTPVSASVQPQTSTEPGMFEL